MLYFIQRGHGLLHGLGDVRLHGLGAGPGAGGHNDHIGEVHIGHQVRRHLQVRHHTQHQYGQHSHKHRKGFFYAEFRHPIHSSFWAQRAQSPPGFPAKSMPPA